MPQGGLIAIVPVRPGIESALRERLNRWGNDVRRHHLPATEPSIDLEGIPTLHFARFALLADPFHGDGRVRLLLATDFDGDLAAHLEELHARTQQPELLWGCLEGYPGPSGFAAFLQRHAIQPGAYYMAFRNTTRRTLEAAQSLVAAWEADVDRPGGRQRWQAWPDLRDLILWFQGLASAIVQPVTLGFRLAGALWDGLKLIRTHGWSESIQAARRINATLGRVGWIRVFNALFNNRPAPATHPYSEASPHTPALPTPPDYPPEDSVHQNQLTLVTDIRPEALAGLKAVLGVIELYARRLASPGSLVGIGTIHTVRWALLDGGARLLMVSNYDGTWENYIDEFAEMILSGLDALWTSAPDYPEAGAQDVEALKEFLRRHQVPANVFYSAYPHASVLNLKGDLEFHRRFGWLLRPRLLRNLPSPPARLPQSGRGWRSEAEPGEGPTRAVQDR